MQMFSKKLNVEKETAKQLGPINKMIIFFSNLTNQQLTKEKLKLKDYQMELIVNKYQQRFKKIKGEMSRWEQLQSLLISQFSNASSIIQRLQVIQDSKNYGVLKCVVDGIENTVLVKQMKSLQTILQSMNKTMEEFRGVVLFLEKMVRDSKQLSGGCSAKLSAKQLKLRVGIKPTLGDCLGGLKLLEEMHQSEYRLKLSLVSALPDIALKPSAMGDLNVLQQLLVDQPNIPQEEDKFQHAWWTV